MTRRKKHFIQQKSQSMRLFLELVGRIDKSWERQSKREKKKLEQLASQRLLVKIWNVARSERFLISKMSESRVDKARVNTTRRAWKQVRRPINFSLSLIRTPSLTLCIQWSEEGKLMVALQQRKAASRLQFLHHQLVTCWVFAFVWNKRGRAQLFQTCHMVAANGYKVVKQNMIVKNNWVIMNSYTEKIILRENKRDYRHSPISWI